MTDQAKHSPGPWRISNNELGFAQYDILADVPGFPNTGIARLVAPEFADCLTGSVALDIDTIAANARLICLAPLIPEMVEALEESARYMGLMAHPMGTLEKVRTILAKVGEARGDQNENHET